MLRFRAKGSDANKALLPMTTRPMVAATTTDANAMHCTKCCAGRHEMHDIVSLTVKLKKLEKLFAGPDYDKLTDETDAGLHSEINIQ